MLIECFGTLELAIPAEAVRTVRHLTVMRFQGEIGLFDTVWAHAEESSITFVGRPENRIG
jgi:hypothetical protein